MHLSICIQAAHTIPRRNRHCTVLWDLVMVKVKTSLCTSRHSVGLLLIWGLIRRCKQTREYAKFFHIAPQTSTVYGSQVKALAAKTEFDPWHTNSERRKPIPPSYPKTPCLSVCLSSPNTPFFSLSHTHRDQKFKSKSKSFELVLNISWSE